MKKLYAALLLALTTQACYVGDEPAITAPAAPQASTDIDAFIWQSVKRSNRPFNWAAAPNELIWSALRQSDEVLSVGYKPAGHAGDLGGNIHRIDVTTGDWKQARDQLLELVYTEERKSNPELKRSEVEAFTEETLPVINVKVRSLATVQQLRASGLVRYVEPMGYEPQAGGAQARLASSSGCGSNTPNPALVAGRDFATIEPATKSAWHHPFHGIRDGWTRSSGAGIKLMIIDTGISPDQNNLTSSFNQGFSGGRTVERLVTLPKAWPWSAAETPDDGCGHGTSMAGVAVGPRGTDGAAAGIAYNAGLVSVRAAADVFLDASREVKGVSDAFVLAGNRADIQIVSLSLGRVTSSSQLADAIRYAHNRGKLIFCAGGTSFGWSSGWVGVVFPASMDEVQAVTGIKDNLTGRCDACHEGSQIDFVTVMEQTATGLHVPTLAMSGDLPSTVGGSSVATASLAGMAAMIWAQNPNQTREQVVDRLARSSNFFPNRNGNFGWGRPNVNSALNLSL